MLLKLCLVLFVLLPALAPFLYPNVWQVIGRWFRLAVALTAAIFILRSPLNIGALIGYFKNQVSGGLGALSYAPDKIYLDGREVGTVVNATINPTSQTIHFDSITTTLDFLAGRPAMVQYMGLALSGCPTIGGILGAPPSPYRYTNVTCSTR